MFKSDVMKAFTLPNNNGKGFSAMLCQEIFLNLRTTTAFILTDICLESKLDQLMFYLVKKMASKYELIFNN